MFWPCETRTSICRNLATISSGLYRFLAITVLLDVKDIPQVGPLQWGWIRSLRQFRPEPWHPKPHSIVLVYFGAMLNPACSRIPASAARPPVCEHIRPALVIVLYK